MKKFLEKHILFPKGQGLTAYYYLFFLFPILAGLIGLPLWQQLLGFALVILFLKAYRDAFWREHFAYKVAIQLAIALIFAIIPWFSSVGLQIFTGFQLGFSPVSRKSWRQYLTAYYAVALVSVAVPMSLYGLDTADPSELVWVIVGIFFILWSPIFAKAISRTYDLTEQNRRLTERVQKMERERIAYDLHDNLGQTFSTISLQAELAAKLIDKKPEAAKAELAKIADNARASLTLVREIVSNLKSESVSQILTDAKQSLALAGIELTVIGDGQAFPNPAPEVLKEALTNIARHSQATQAQVTFVSTDGNFQLTVSDNGVGIGTSQPSHGLLGMKKRVEDAGGTISVSTDKGTTIKVILRKDKK